MSEPPVINASPLIIFAQGGLLDLLHVIGESILVPRTVHQEVSHPGTGEIAVEALRSRTWIRVVDPAPTPESVRRQRLDAGEEAVLSWSLAHPGTIAIIDDRRGRRAAALLGIPVIGTLGVIAEAKLKGVIPVARPVVDHLLSTTDWYLSPHLRKQVLARLGE